MYGKEDNQDMYTFDSRIRYSELDETGHLKIEALLDYFQDCSTFHSEDLGLGVEYLKKQNLVWVMSAWQIVVERYPKLGETVTIGTAPYSFKGFVGYRNFLMTDVKGERLACANTVWGLISTENAKPVRLTEKMREKYVLEPPIEMEYASRRIHIPENVQRREPVQIKAHHLDTNHHVNNGQYVKIAMDTLPGKCQVKQLRAEYKKQVFLNDILIPYVSDTQDGKYVVVLKDEKENICSIVELQEERK